MKLYPLIRPSLESKIEKVIASYLIADDVNHRQKLIQIMYKACKDYIGQEQLKLLLAPFIERLQAISDPDARVYTLLGFFYRLNLDFATAIPFIEKGIKQNDANALFLIAYIQMQGLNGKKDPVQARINFTTASQMGHSFAMNSLGVLLMNENKWEEACKWYFNSTILGCHLAKSNIQEYISSLFKLKLKPKPPFFSSIQNSQDRRPMNFVVPSYEDQMLIAFQLEFPPCYDQLSKPLQNIFLIAANNHVIHLFSEHMSMYQQALKNNASEAESLKTDFDRNIKQHAQDTLNELWMTYFSEYFAKPLEQSRPISSRPIERNSGFALK